MKKYITPKENRLKLKFMTPTNIALFVLLLLYVIAFFTVIIWSLLSAITTIDAYESFYCVKQIRINLPLERTFENIIAMISELKVETTSHQIFDMWGLYANSLIYSVGCALIWTMVPCVVAYATARFKFKSSKIIYMFVIVTMALPIVGSTASELKMLDNLNIKGTMFSMFILKFNFLSVYYLVFFAQFEMIPKDYTEAAKIDGASNFNIMINVIMPLAAGTMVTVFVLTFIGFWNDYQTPLLYIPNYPTASYWIYAVFNNKLTDAITEVPKQLAGTFIMVLPVIIVYAVFNKQLRISVAVGGIKG